MATIDNIVADLRKAIESAKSGKTQAYDTVATVKRVAGNTAWVQIPGGTSETPVQLTIACQPGDTVQVRVGGGRAWLTGNQSAPPTDDTTARNAQTRASEAKSAAGQAQESADEAGEAANKAQAAAGEAQSTATGLEVLVSGGYTVHSEIEGVDVDSETFLAQFGEYAELASSYTFIMSGSAWTMDGDVVDLDAYGITVASGITTFVVDVDPITGLTAESDDYEIRIKAVEDTQNSMNGDVTALQSDMESVSDRQSSTDSRVNGIDSRLGTAENTLNDVTPIIDKISKQVEVNETAPYVEVKAGAKSVKVTESQVQFKTGSSVQAYAGSESFVAPSLQSTQILMRTRVDGAAVGSTGLIMRSNGHVSIKKVTGGE